MLSAMRRAMASLPPEPFAEMMRRRGAPPEAGWVLVIPEAALRASEHSRVPLPYYVKVSRLVTVAFLINASALELTP